MTSLDPTLIYQLPPIGPNREPVEIQVLIIISALLCRIWNNLDRYVQRDICVDLVAYALYDWISFTLTCKLKTFYIDSDTVKREACVFSD